MHIRSETSQGEHLKRGGHSRTKLAQNCDVLCNLSFTKSYIFNGRWNDEMITLSRYTYSAFYKCEDNSSLAQAVERIQPASVWAFASHAVSSP